MHEATLCLPCMLCCTRLSSASDSSAAASTFQGALGGAGLWRSRLQSHKVPAKSCLHLQQVQLALCCTEHRLAPQDSLQ